MKHLACLPVILLGILSAACAGAAAPAGAPMRARDLGIPFDGEPGPLNAITDVAGVTVGHTTLIEARGAGHEVRTGVTAILPRGEASARQSVFGGWFALNGNGEMTGTTWLEESGLLEGPVMITNTHSVGVVRDAVIDWRVRKGAADASGYWWSLPIVAETWDGHLNDINGFHVKPEHVHAALDRARGGRVEEGNVGGGTGMICHEFKCGIGTASRRVSIERKPFVVGALVQANYGIRDTLRIAGVPVGRHLRENRVYSEEDAADSGSIIIVVGTDAPLLPHQLERIARRAALGLARNGSYAGNGSGDIFVAFSTANGSVSGGQAIASATFVANEAMDPLFRATVEATEEAIVNSMIAARDMRGQDGHFVNAIPHDQLRAVMAKYGRSPAP